MATKLTEHKVVAEKMHVKVIEQIHLMTQNCQLSFAVTDQGHLLTTYFGKKIGDVDLAYVVSDIVRASYLADTDGIKNYKVEQLPLTYPSFANTDLNLPAIHLEYDDGSRLSDFRYLSHQFLSEKPQIGSMPSARSSQESQTLLIVLADKLKSLRLTLIITAYPEDNVFTQHVKLENLADTYLTIDRIMSAHLMFLRDDFELITLTGAWGRETHAHRRPLVQGFQGVNSNRGASGHGQNPFMALVSSQTTQNTGSVYGFSLVYSGNFLAGCEVDMHQNTRLQMGLNPFDFSWQLDPSASFETPEVIMTFTENGLNDMSQNFHKFFTEHIVPKRFAEKMRPVLINNWEATYFDFDEKVILEIAQKASEVGAELFVLDDGWYGKRQDEMTSLGDWIPNEVKLGGSLNGLIEKIKSLGLDFGIWFEPEMISEDSNLYRYHPDWLMQTSDRAPQRVRSQYVLDLTRDDVQDYIIDSVGYILNKYPVNYVKWDMNRNLTDIYSSQLPNNRQKEVAHRYILGLYRILNIVTSNHPDVLFESCAGGGGRFDAGMLYYTSQIWTSDDTDAIARLAIQEGNSYVYPSAAMSGHVSAVPNHQIGRETSLATRTAVAQQGNFGYELDLTKLSTQEIGQIKADIQEYKKYRKTLQFGQHTRLEVNDPNNEHAWQKTDKDWLIITHVQILVKPNTVPKRLRLTKLDESKCYKDEKGKIYTAIELMAIGLPINKPIYDYYATVWRLKVLEVR